MTVSVLVPWRDDTAASRAQAWAFARRWWETEWPGWQLVVGTCPDGPWVKALAVGDALTRADGDLLVVADADVLVPGIRNAVAKVKHLAAPWAMPHERVYRLGQAATQTLYDTGQLPDTNWSRVRGVYDSYRGVAGGGCVVLSRALYERVPLDPRFTGWGQEDQSWARALDVIAGPPWRNHAPLWHLWHPPARVLRRGEVARPGENTRLTRALGSPDGVNLFRRYRSVGTAAGMTALLDEFRTPAVAPPGDSTS